MATRDTQVVGVAPRISREQFIESLRGTPAEAEAGESYDVIVAETVDPLFLRYVFRHESSDGTAGVTPTYNTKSPGNTRTSSTGKGSPVFVPGKGSYIKHARWVDGWQDAAHRLVHPGYPYTQRGAVTIAQIIPIWAPSSDNNSPSGYINAVVRDMTNWEENNTNVDATSLIGQRIAAHGIEVHDIRSRLSKNGNYHRFPLDHWTHTAGHYTAVWRERGTLEQDIASWQGHARYHVNTQGWPGIAYAIGLSMSGRVFLLRDLEEMGYHAFSANEIALGLSCDTTLGQTPTPEILRSLNIVLRVLHTESPELSNLHQPETYGHKELGFYDSRNYSTNCPGQLLTYLQTYRGGADFSGDIPEREHQENHAVVTLPDDGREFWVIENFFQRWTEPKANVLVFGYPLTGMYGDGADRVQVFERAIMRHKEGAYPDKWDVLLELVGSEAAVIRNYLTPEGVPVHAAFQPLSPDTQSDDTTRFFLETGHRVGGGFLAYWGKYGSLDYFGFPISEEFVEDGKTVQYFQRSRFEHHPGADPHHYDVVLGRLGGEVHEARGADGQRE